MPKYKNYDTVLYDDLRQLYRASAEHYAGNVLFLERADGAFKEYTYREYADDVEALGTELLSRGLGGKRILVIGENCYHWLVAHMAVICGVGTVVPVDKDLPAGKLTEIAAAAEAGAVIFSAKSKDKADALDPSVVRIPFDSLPELCALGKEKIAAGDRSYLDAPLDPFSMAALLFTSGTTGASKGVMLSHFNFTFNVAAFRKMVRLSPSDRFLSVLPLHHAFEYTCGFLCQLYSGCSVAFCEGLRFLTRDMQETRPTVMNCVPMIMETMYEKVQTNIRKLGMEKRVRAAVKMTDTILPAAARLATKRRVFSDIHKSFGGKLRMMIVGGAAVNPAVMKGFRELGILTIQGYVLSECAPIAALNRDSCPRDDSAGMAPPDCILDIYDADENGIGEIRFKGDNIMLGYYQNPELSNEVLRNGWFYTGDLGSLDKNGFLSVLGRKDQ